MVKGLVVREESRRIDVTEWLKVCMGVAYVV